MTEFLIGYPDIPFIGTFLYSQGAETGFPVENIVTGDRNAHWISTSSITQAVFELDGATSRTPEYAWFSNANLIRRKDSADYTLSIMGSVTSSFTIGNTTYSDTIGLSDLGGPRDEDLLITSLGISIRRFYRIKIITTESFKHEIGKFYFGNWFNFDREPLVRFEKQLTFGETDQRAPKWQHTLEWLGVANTKRNTFISNIVKWADVNPVLLYDQSGKVFDGFSSLHAFIKGVEISPRSANYTDIRVEFEEVI